jgi:hypothetical protein
MLAWNLSFGTRNSGHAIRGADRRRQRHVQSYAMWSPACVYLPRDQRIAVPLKHLPKRHWVTHWHPLPLGRR